MNVAVLPAKPLALAKTRLANALAPEARMAIARAMFDDVLAALRRTAVLDAVLVVTADASLAERARAGGAGVVDEGAPRGLNGAVALGSSAAAELGADLVVVVLSDVPLVEPGDVRELVARTPRRGGLLVPSKEGTGTNAMVRRPPAAFPPSFGGRSLERHVAAAQRRHLPCVLWNNARLAFDVDTPDDLRVLLADRSATATYRAALDTAIATGV